MDGKDCFIHLESTEYERQNLVCLCISPSVPMSRSRRGLLLQSLSDSTITHSANLKWRLELGEKKMFCPLEV
jgi:hypothetical protein